MKKEIINNTILIIIRTLGSIIPENKKTLRSFYSETLYFKILVNYIVYPELSGFFEHENFTSYLNEKFFLLPAEFTLILLHIYKVYTKFTKPQLRRQKMAADIL